MRNLKKVLALVIAFSMMLSVVAFASYNDVAADAEYAGAVELLSALEIIKGDDLGNFNPDNTITRAEMAAIVCRAKGLESAANGAKGFTAFNDVAADHWASGYVNLASQNGIINGYGDGNFGPEDTVTYEQAVKMLVCALGFEPMAATKGGFPTGYLVVANTYGVTEGVTATVEAPRKTVAQLVYNALSTPMMDQTAFGADAEYEIFDGKKDRDFKSLLTEMDIYIATGVVEDVELDDVTFTIKEDSDDLEFSSLKDYCNETLQVNGSNIADYQFQYVDVYVKKDARKDYQIVAIVGSATGERFELLSDDIKDVIVDDKTKDEVKVEYYVDPANSSKTKEIKIDITRIVENKNDVTSTKKVSDYKGVDDYELVFIENDGNTTYDVLVATKYTSDRVDSVDVDRDKMVIGGKTVTFDFEDEDVDVILVDDEGNELTLADFAEDDVVAYVYEGDSVKSFGDYIKIVKLSNAAVTGTVDEAYTSNGDKYVVIDGAEYIDASGMDLKVSDEGTFYVGMTGKVIDFEGSAAGENYAYILEAAKSTSSFSADMWQVKLLTKADGIVTYDVTKDADTAFDTYFAAKGTAFTANKDGDYLFSEATDANKKDVARLITYKANSKGEIRSFEPAEVLDKDGKVVTGYAAIDKSKDDYSDRTQIIGGYSLEDDVAIFNISGSDAEDAYATDISYLVDEGKYTGFVFADEDGEACVMVVLDGTGKFSEELGFAVVTKATTSKDAEDNDVTKITYVQDEEEGVLIFNDEDSETDGKIAYDKMGVGDVFVFSANADGVVTDYMVIAQIVVAKDSKGNEFNKIALSGVAGSEIGDETELVEGIIENTEYKKTSKGENITVNGKVYSISADANKYTYNDAGRNTIIETEDFLAEDAYYYDVEDKLATPVILRIVDGVVIDIYTSNTRVEVK